MKEIIYVQAGKLSNYTGTHFWNTQESYLSSNEHEVAVDSRVSFCENLDEQGRSTLCPRVLIVDQKGEFGGLSPSNALGESTATADALDHSIWSGSTVEHQEQHIPKSAYHTQLESEQNQENPGEIRYWSDYSRVFFLPRSLHRLPDASGFDHWDWHERHQVFQRFNEEVEFMDGPLRLLAEDCDNMQGIQILNDTTTFGSFMNSFLSCFRDEYSKLPSLTFSMLALRPQYASALGNDEESRRLLNEALYFRNLNELSSMNVPVLEPSFWPTFVWNNPLYWPSESVYHQSALISSHIESGTLPFRLSHEPTHGDMASIFSHLKNQNDSSFGELSGAFPIDTSFDEQAIADFSSCGIDKSPEARVDVIRGFSKNIIEGYQQWSSKSISTPVRCIDGPAYPLPSSFPSFSRPESQPPALRGANENSLEFSQMFSSLSSTSTTTAQRFQHYAAFVDTCIKRKSYISCSMGFGIDDTRELANDLWTICDNSGSVEL